MYRFARMIGIAACATMLTACSGPASTGTAGASAVGPDASIAALADGQSLSLAGRAERVRKNVKDLTAQERSVFINAIKTLKQTPSPTDDMVGNWYDHFVASHLRKLICYTDEADQGGFGHYGPDLLTWHRAFLLEFEDALSTVAGTAVALPYWDWTDPDSLAVMLSDDVMGPPGTKEDGYVVMSGPFRKGEWQINVKGFPQTNPGQFDDLVRATGTITDQPPSAEDVDEAMKRPTYDVEPWGLTSDDKVSFRNYVDGMYGGSGVECLESTVWNPVGVTGARLHGQGHVFIGGNDDDGNPGALSDTATSPNDPIFWLHHVNIDRIAEQWWSQHDYEFLPQRGGPRGTNIDDQVWPYLLTNGQMAQPSSSFGYTYSPSSPSNELPAVQLATGSPVSGSGSSSGSHTHGS